jgi:hypothetical protein
VVHKRHGWHAARRERPYAQQLQLSSTGECQRRIAIAQQRGCSLPCSRLSQPLQRAECCEAHCIVRNACSPLVCSSYWCVCSWMSGVWLCVRAPSSGHGQGRSTLNCPHCTQFEQALCGLVAPTIFISRLISCGVIHSVGDWPPAAG